MRKNLINLFLSGLLFFSFNFSADARLYPEKSHLQIEPESSGNIANLSFSNHQPELNEISLYYTAEDMANLLINEISKAEKLIQIDVFLFGQSIGNQIIDILEEKHKQGVEIRILFDENLGFGGIPDKFFKEIITRLNKSGLNYKLYPLKELPRFVNVPLANNSQIDHNKLVVIDGKTMITGGVNLFDFGLMNRDIMIKLVGPTAFYMSERMDRDWNLRGAPAKKINISPYYPSPKSERSIVRVVETSRNESSIKPAIINMIDSAKKSVYIQVLEFSEPDVINALIRAKKRGIDVRVLLDRKAEDTNMKYTGLSFPVVPGNMPNVVPMLSLQKENIAVRYYDPRYPNQELHVKACLIDNNRYILGSSNFTTQAFTTWRETSLEVIGGDSPEKLEEFFLQDWYNHSSPPGRTNFGHNIATIFVNFMERNYLGWW